jgi:hypothetical protein
MSWVMLSYISKITFVLSSGLMPTQTISSERTITRGQSINLLYVPSGVNTAQGVDY